MSRALQRQRQHRGVLLVATSKLRRLRMSHTFIATPAHAVGTARETHDVARNVRRVALVREPAPVRAAPAVVDRGVTAFSVRTPQAVLERVLLVALILAVRTAPTVAHRAPLAASALVALVDAMCVQVVR